MAKKKQAKTAKNFSEAIGFGNIFKNDIFNFIFGFVLLLLEYPSGIPEQLRIDRSRHLLFLHLPLLRSFGIYHPCTHGVNRSEDDACL